MSFDPINSPYNTYGVPQHPTGAMPPNFSNQQMMGQQQMYPAQPHVNLETPAITTGTKDGFMPKFTIKKDNGGGNVIPVDNIADSEKNPKRGRPKKETGSGTGIVRASAATPASGTVEDAPTAYSYAETTNMLHDTLGQIDMVNRELLQEFDMVKSSRTLKNKHKIMTDLSENIGSMISNRIQVIKEINSSISKANDMDYKKEKDRKHAMANVDDDKYISDLYKSFIQNPVNVGPTPQYPNIDPALFGSGVVRADLGGFNPAASGAGTGTTPPPNLSYLNYMSNLSPEQNLMRYENNPNAKQVVVFDAATGNRFFQFMDLSTGQVIPNVPVYDQMFMEDTTLDLKTKIAKNINLNETFPIVVINEGVTNEY